MDGDDRTELSARIERLERKIDRLGVIVIVGTGALVAWFGPHVISRGWNVSEEMANWIATGAALGLGMFLHRYLVRE